MTRAAFTLALALGPLALGSGIHAQPPQAPSSSTAPEKKSDEGFPITNDTVKRKCSGCHRADDKGRLTRISFRRTTPEGWEQTVKRMISLNGLKIEPDEAREVVRYLADRQGLAPEEQKPAAFEVERRAIDYHYAGPKDDKDKKITEETCTACHSMGRVLSQRRTKEEWELLVAMHRGYYWLSDFQAFRRTGPPRPEPQEDGQPADNRHPMDVAIGNLSSAFPLMTPAWSAWSATMRVPQLDGRWALSGYEIGKGALFGTVTIASGSNGTFTTSTDYTVPATGEHVARKGQAIVYTGYQWRGRSSGDGSDRQLREVMFVDPDWRRAEGRWFTGAYDEIGMDVTLTRIGNDPIVLGVASPMLKTGQAGQPLRVYGANLPAQVAPAALNLGAGVTVDRVVSAAPDQLNVLVSVANDATAGRRTVILAGATGTAAIAVAGGIDYIKVLPQAGLARVGGANFPKQLQPFEAVAYANGSDGKPDTKDDIELGRVDASWSLEEYTATFDDDDKDFVGTIDAKTGLFTPNLDGPNPKRKHNADNYGDVWVVASYDAPGGRSLKARAHLLVTVPLYIKFDQPEVGR